MPPCIGISYFNITENSCYKKQQNVTKLSFKSSTIILWKIVCVLYAEKYATTAVCYFQITYY
jgi:hypothetical protein